MDELQPLDGIPCHLDELCAEFLALIHFSPLAFTDSDLRAEIRLSASLAKCVAFGRI